jgi:hypothetical protein
MTILIVIIWALAAALLVALAIASMSRQSAAQRDARARGEVRTALMAFTQPGRAQTRPDLEWWSERVHALERELTPALAENPAVRTSLEAIAAAATAQVLPLALAPPAGPQDRARLDRLGRLVCLAPTRASRRALLALQAGADDTLALRASGALARHASLFADASAPLACAADLESNVVRSMALRWALARMSASDPTRAAVHARDEAPVVRRAVLAEFDARVARSVAGSGTQVGALALAHVSDPDAGVRAAAFGALARATMAPRAAVDQGLSDADPGVRAAAARALPAIGREALPMLPGVERMDPGAAREVSRALRPAPTPEVERHAVDGLRAHDAETRRASALALATLARNPAAPRLQADSIAALLGRLESERSAAVSAALVEALEASGDDRAAAALATLALRATPEWRLRLTEASTLARRLHGAAANPSPPPTDRRRSPR